MEMAPAAMNAGVGPNQTMRRLMVDVVTQPDHAVEFLKIRLIATSAVLAILAVTYTPTVNRRIVWLGPTPAFIAAGAISMMVQRLGGYDSPYRLPQSSATSSKAG
jgi:hypothetical protein